MPLIVTPGALNRRAELYHQLGSMIAAGVPLIKALEMVSAKRSTSNPRSIFRQLIQHLQSGKTFSQSMAETHGWLPEFDVALLGVGEKTGRLDSSFKLLALYYAFRSQIIRDTISGLIVTIATLHVFILVFPLSYLIQLVQGIMTDHYSQCIPFILEKIAVFGGLYGAVFFLAFACQGNRGPTWRALMESITRAIPILRTAQKYLVLARLTGALEALNSAGVNVVTAWELAAGASGSQYLRRHIGEWKHSIASGVTPAELVNQTSYFPVLFANLYDTGEQSGKLDETLKRLQTYYQEEGFRALRLFTRILNGIIYGSVVMLVAYNVVGFYTGYYNDALKATE